VESIDARGWKRLDDSHAIVFGSPTFMGNVSSAFQAFSEAASKRWTLECGGTRWRPGSRTPVV
jgi:multimeric flavodoxin WrbA